MRGYGAADALILLSAVLFAVTGLAYLFAPEAALGLVGIESAGDSQFILRTEGVLLLTCAAILYGARSASLAGLRVVLGALAFYYVVGSLVDVAAFAEGIVGPLSLPSAAIRVVLGIGCVLAMRGVREK